MLSKKIPRRNDLTTIEYEFNKEKDEFTFSPRLIKPNPDKKLIPPFDPKASATIERLKKAREKNLKGNYERIDIGMRFNLENNKFKTLSGAYDPNNKANISNNRKLSPFKRLGKNNSNRSFRRENKKEKYSNYESTSFNSKLKEKKFYVDINLGDTIERIEINKNDTASELSERFINNHRSEINDSDIPSLNQRKLRLLLRPH